MICKYEINNVEGEMDSPDSRSAARTLLNGEWPVCTEGNQTCNPPETFRGIKSRTEVHITVIGQNRVNYEPQNMDRILRELELEMINGALKLSGGAVGKAATLLGINRTTLYMRLNKIKQKRGRRC